ncbi:MAG: hypothetical protein ABI240_17180, partial [Sphingomonas sp.]
AVPVKEAAQQREGIVDRVDMGLRFSAHHSLQTLSVIPEKPGTHLDRFARTTGGHDQGAM